MAAKTNSFLPLAYSSVMRSKSASERTSSKTIWSRCVTRASSWPMVVTPPASATQPSMRVRQWRRMASTGLAAPAQAEFGGEVGDFGGVFESAHSSSRNSFTPS